MITKTKVKEYIQSEYYYTFSHVYRDPIKKQKLEAVAKAASKFINKYTKSHYVDSWIFENVVDACLQSYSTDECLTTFLEREKHQWVGNKY
jgi:hypothetical protein